MTAILTILALISGFYLCEFLRSIVIRHERIKRRLAGRTA